MARTKYAEHVGHKERRDKHVSRSEYLLNARANAPRGVELPQTKLLPLDIGEIRSAARQRTKLRQYIADNLSNDALAKKFGVHRRTVEKVLSYETGSHVP
jgi:hypothetical protein